MRKRIALASVTSRVHDISVANATLMAANLQELDSPDADDAGELPQTLIHSMANLRLNDL